MKILISNITDSGIYRNRSEFIQELISCGHKVIIVSPRSEVADMLISLGCEFIEITVQRHGIKPKEEFKVIKQYWHILRHVKPDLVFTFTIKPNLYLGLLCRLLRIPQAMNITGLGEGLMHEGRTKKILMRIYPIATKRVHCIFFQNKFNRSFFVDNRLAEPCIMRMLPGSGVNITKFQPLEYPSDNVKIKFLFVSRIVKDKGIDELIEAFTIVKQKYPQIELHIAGGCSEEYKESLTNWINDRLVVYHGRVSNMIPLYSMAHCLIHPSYHEGMANVILEAAACARPCIATNINGCKEAINNKESGLLVEVADVHSLMKAIEDFAAVPYTQKKAMGEAGRIKMEQEFDRQFVVNEYMKVVNEIDSKNK